MDIIRIMKTNAWIMGVYAMIRAVAVLNCLWADCFAVSGLPLTIIAGIAVLILVRFLTGNMWKPKGMLSLTFMFSLIVSDIAVIIINLITEPVSGCVLFFPGFDLFLSAEKFNAVKDSLACGGALYLIWICGGIGLITWGIMMLCGYINETRVKATEYKIESDKISGCATVCVISDIHFGTIQKKDTLARHIDIINNYKPDIILLAGDIAEEHTSGEDMAELFVLLSRLKSKYGTYFVHGNHDKQQKLTAKERSYSDEAFDSAMKNAGIICLDDDHIDLQNNVTIIGRNDYTEKSRKSIDELLKDTDPLSYRILLEHQPEEYEESAAAGIDLHITGHYHGAQNWPNNILYRLADIKYLGMYHIGNMKLLVNAGFTGSQYPIRTHSKCEYLIINLNRKDTTGGI